MTTQATPARLAVGIDLGTTNTVVAYDADGSIAVFDLAQHVAPGEVAALDQLASALYLPGKDEFSADAFGLPWQPAGQGYAVGRFAAAHAAKVPGRGVLSSKSWLSFAGVDRRAGILPWSAADDVARISPVEAARRILVHVQAAWDSAHPDAPLSTQDVVLTVPASFDEVARELTVEAARAAGLAVRLLEEPQAALYAWLADAAGDGPALEDTLAAAKLALVVDVGGGTTDLTLVATGKDAAGQLTLDRVAVGDHLMLGGDNMDLAIGRLVEHAVTGSYGALAGADWGALVQSARLAKETLLGEDAPDEVRVVIPSRGKKLIGGGRSHTVAKDGVRAMLLDGFFPAVDREATPAMRTQLALTEYALPYAKDPAITRHIAAFLRRHVGAAERAGAGVTGGMAVPDVVLLNGGVFQSAAIRDRLADVLESWFGHAPALLNLDGLSHAVARGAVQSTLVRRGQGMQIGGGTARAYFVGVTDAEGTERALCVAPRGLGEGQKVELDRTFMLKLGQPVAFDVFTSSGDVGGAVGEVLAPDHAELERLPKMTAVLTAPKEVPVRISTHLTDIGTLELRLDMQPAALASYKLGFSTRVEGERSEKAAPAGPVHKNIDAAKEVLAHYYAKKPKKGVDPAGVKQLRRQLEKLLGARDTWNMALSRELFGALMAGAARRRRSADHERAFFQLAGFCVRPGFGAPHDDWRLDTLFELWAGSVQHVKEKPGWTSWWIMWRRAAAGLNAERQQTVYDDVWPWLDKSQGKPKPGPRPHGEPEMIRLLASLERLPAETRAALGAWVLKRLNKGAIKSWWALGRIGARVPVAGSAHNVVPPEQAEKWLEQVCAQDWKTTEGAALCAAQLARFTGDRARDVPDKWRARVSRMLGDIEADQALIDMVETGVVPDASDTSAAIMGDALPAGLTM